MVENIECAEDCKEFGTRDLMETFLKERLFGAGMAHWEGQQKLTLDELRQIAQKKPEPVKHLEIERGR